MLKYVSKIKEKIKTKFINDDHIKYIFVLFLVNLVLIAGLFGNTSYFSGHDSKYHIAVVSAYEKQIDISKGKILPTNILPEIAKDYGYGTGVFYPQLPHLTATYIYKAINILGLDVTVALKIAHSIALILSSMSMYFLAFKVSNNKKIATLSSIILLVMPFRIAEIMVRDAFAECFTYIFIPMILLGIFELIDKNYKRFMCFFTIGYIGMLISHQVLTLYITILLIPILICYVKELMNKKTIVYSIISILMIIIIALPSVFPMLYHKLNGNYVVFNGDAMGGYKKIHKHSLSISDLILPSNGGIIAPNSINSRINFNINIITIMLCGITIYYLGKLKLDKGKKKRILVLGISTVFTLWMSTNLFPWKYLPDFMYMIQFPWRLLTFSCITISIIAPLCFKAIEKEKGFKIVCLIVIGIMLSAGLETISYHYKEDIAKLNIIDMWNNGMGSQKEYLPVKTLENYEYFKKRNNEIIIQSGNATIEKKFDRTPTLRFVINETKDKTVIELPRLFYFGYTLTNITTGSYIDIYENENGFINAEISETGEYILEYTGLQFLNIYKYFLIIAIVVSIIIICKHTIKKKKRHDYGETTVT